MSAADYAWMESALCAQADPDLWVSTTSGVGYSTPKRICQRCPVQAECTAHAEALEAADDIVLPGIWGGTSRNQRQKARRHNQIGDAA